MARGLFIVLEGLDRSGKSTQCARLVSAMTARGKRVVTQRFPDRTTTIGQMINAYLTQQSDLDDRAIHLLFSANRWEKAAHIRQLLQEGTDVVCDRYAFSGIAFSAIKPGLSYEWCKACDVGLPAPDLVIFLDVPASAAESRGGFGDERYETSAVQQAVWQVFDRIGKDVGLDKWRVVNAGQSIDKVESDIQQLVDQVRTDTPIASLWQ